MTKNKKTTSLFIKVGNIGNYGWPALKANVVQYIQLYAFVC